MTSPETQHALAQRILPRLQARGFTAEYAATHEEARLLALKRIPHGADVMTGSSKTLETLGIVDALTSGDYRYRKSAILRENDGAARLRLRKESTLADWFLGSVPAITEDGLLVAVDGSGSRVSAYAFGAGHVVLLVSLNKIVANLEAAMRRIREDVFPQEDARMKAIGAAGTSLGKWLVYERENQKDRVHVILVGGEPLGF